MKKLLSVVLLSILGVAAISTAAPRGPDWKPERSLSSVEDFQSLKAGDTVAQVCTMCDTVSTIQIKSKEQAMELCKEGAMINCPSCDSKAKATRGSPRPESDRGAVRFVNEHGKECMFMAKVDSVGDTHKSIDRGSNTPHR
ncbi:hypothetical protein QEH59_12475 [Coraliomargarita sp. SDUM461004]|uniref:Uncharacterized protein n=1 Tax=Thalassobacterium sedimentorum TaxID=3041258 RepID=A0ABU1ANB1_9BACT|nr:hypothetical protein [Coraliomargarita sp. SDUM461004]MDQ8195246.1 hypothetical protein [Coraliomargarita sp. SDUM461004]